MSDENKLPPPPDAETLDVLAHCLDIDLSQEMFWDHVIARAAYMKGVVIRYHGTLEPINDYRAARGVLNWDDWNEPAEVSIRRLRDGS